MKVIFLDIDGVLNTESTLPLVPYEMCKVGDRVLTFNRLDEKAIANLNKVTDATGAKIVISSSWRNGVHSVPNFLRILSDYLKECGVTGEVISRTPVYKEYRTRQNGDLFTCRGDEIQLWLNQHLVDSFVIVDDNSDMDHLTDRLVMTEFECGITEANAQQMIDLLNIPTPNYSKGDLV